MHKYYYYNPGRQKLLPQKVYCFSKGRKEDGKIKRKGFKVKWVGNYPIQPTSPLFRAARLNHRRRRVGPTRRSLARARAQHLTGLWDRMTWPPPCVRGHSARWGPSAIHCGWFFLNSLREIDGRSMELDWDVALGIKAALHLPRPHSLYRAPTSATTCPFVYRMTPPRTGGGCAPLGLDSEFTAASHLSASPCR